MQESALALISSLKQTQQTVVILGAGRTGIAVARFFLELGLAIEIWDENTRKTFLSSNRNRLILEQLESFGAIFRFEKEQKTINRNSGLIIKSPGIPPESDLFTVPGLKDVPVFSELELGMLLFAEALAARSVVVTGSNGKSTTTALIHHILSSIGLNSLLCGNIGDPVIEKIPADFLKESRHDEFILAVEASSYQLTDCNLCKPDVAVMLNLTENHLDRHGSMQAYLEAKKNLVRRFDTDSVLIINSDDSYSSSYRGGIAGKHYSFGCNKDSDAKIDPGRKEVSFKCGQQQHVFSQDKSNLIGLHNLYNAAAALLACQALDCDLSAAIEASYSFMGLEHRLEKIALSANRVAINDSKATTVSASLAACKAVVESGMDRSIILLVGGEEKTGSDWTPLISYIAANSNSFSQVCLFGACALRLSTQFLDCHRPVKVFPSLGATKNDLFEISSAGNVVLLSPGCASFDEFSDFEDRGRFFKAMLAEL